MPIDALATPAPALTAERCAAPGGTTRTIMVVNGSDDMIGLLEAVLDAGRYDVVFVESTEHAYSQVKRIQPNLVILCTRIEDAGGFHVLSMLKLDDETRRIPVLTYAADFEAQDISCTGALGDADADELPQASPLSAGRMH